MNGGVMNRVRPWAWHASLTLAAVALFLFAVQLLGSATATLGPDLQPIITAIVRGDRSALGASWLAAYGLLNGSVVAAVALSLFAAQLLTAGQLFLMVVGSRLGGAGIVVIIGGLDYLQRRETSLQKGVGLGSLTFLVTHSIYLPVAIVGYLLEPWLETSVGGVAWLDAGGFEWLDFFSPVVTAVTQLVGSALAFALAIVLLVASLRLLDRAISSVDVERLEALATQYLTRHWLSFALGIVVTGVSTSVAFSLGVVVPLYNRGVVTREEIVPYVLGSSIGTLTDTLLVAVVLGSSVGAATVALVFALATVATLVALLWFDRYVTFLRDLHDRLQTDVRAFVLFFALLVVVPLVLLAL
jgi:sodium-dependent phosphate cotransporter